MSIRHRLGRPQRGQLARVPAPREHRPGRPAVLLPAELDLLVDKDEAAEAGIALYRHVHRRWSQLPAGDRPRLVILGESLGPFGAEAAFRGSDGTASLANLVAGSDDREPRSRSGARSTPAASGFKQRRTASLMEADGGGSGSLVLARTGSPQSRSSKSAS
jgi:hypothetical protein